jgi:hypothetical protein
LIDIRLFAPIATLFGVSVSVYLWRLNQQRKVLCFQLLSRQGLVSIRGQARKKLRVNFDGHPVENAQLVMFRLFNAGNKSINAGDYQTDLSLCMNPEAQIVHADVAQTTPVDLEERVRAKGEPAPLIKSVERGKLVITPTLLNPGDEIVLQLLVNNLTEQITVKGHIEGISAPTKWRPRRLVPLLLIYSGALVMTISVLFVEPSALRSFGWENILPYLLFFLLGYVVMWAGLHWPGKKLSIESTSR